MCGPEMGAHTQYTHGAKCGWRRQGVTVTFEYTERKMQVCDKKLKNKETDRQQKKDVHSLENNW